MSGITLKIAVRTLAMLTSRRGDIHFRYDDATQSHEGIDTQRRLQRDRPATYRREAGVQSIWSADGVELELSGRVDGWDPATGTVEEFKTTRAEPQQLHAHAGSVHSAQLRLYAALLAREHPQRIEWHLRLLYCDPDSEAVTAFDETLDAAALAECLDRCCAKLARALRDLDAHRASRNARLAALCFPHADFRPAQRALAAAVYRTARDGGGLLFEAPTGSGKTVGSIYPSLLALGRGHVDRIVFLSSRTTGQAAAEAGVSLHGVDDSLRRITIVAKSKICFMPEPVCDPGLCQYARGYYDRREPAVGELLSARTMSRDVIEAIARKYAICPFELSLDAAVWADFVICDYNYVFDPVVRLQRLAGVTDDRIALLVDEAHQLGDRVRDALSTRLSRAMITTVRRTSADPHVRSRAAALDRRLTRLRSDAVRERNLPPDAFECAIDGDAIAPLLRTAETLLDALTAEDTSSPADAARNELVFALLRLKRVAGWYDPARFATFLRGRARDIEIELRCLDPSAAIADTLNEFRAHVRFSATVSPFELTARTHGVAEARTLRLPSPFPAERLGVFVVPDVSTLYRQRYATVPRLIEVIGAVREARAGNYLVVLPSFEYLDRVADAYACADPHPTIVRQSRSMTDLQRTAFIRAFGKSHRDLVGFAVLGGIFTESIDLPDASLSGIVVVGVGLPPPSLERDAIAARFGEPLGRKLAYEQPAMSRVVQAAGRLIRRESDRGVVCLVDQRFLSAALRDYLPHEWKPLKTPAAELPAALAAFWNRTD